jgi:hypothetical protein
MLRDTDLRGGAWPRLQVPSLWIAGRRDRLVSVQAMELAARAHAERALPAHRARRHAPFLSHAAELATEIEALRGSLARRRAGMSSPLRPATVRTAAACSTASDAPPPVMPKWRCCSASRSRACSSSWKCWKDQVPARILDVGSGPGRASGVMKGRWPKSEVLAPRHRAADAAPGAPAHALLAAGAAGLRRRHRAALRRRQLRSGVFQPVPAVGRRPAGGARGIPPRAAPGGLLLFTSFGPDTLFELREAYLAAGEAHPPLSPFAAIQQVGDALVSAGFRNPVARALRTLPCPMPT